ncbi:MAG: ribosome hibernation-promoting factor, HPF/YfiA family [Candidatus Dojkabacteria bacterium]
MLLEDIKITFVGMEPTEAIKQYVLEKIGKYQHLWEEATSIEVFLKEFVNSKGVEHDFRVDINANLPKSLVRVEVRGEDMYANIDEASDILARRLKRYSDMKMYWEGATPWKVLEADTINGKGDDMLEDYSDYTPSISVRKVLEDMSPLEEGEAIEKMELGGYNQLLFRSKKTNKISMIYKRESGDYGLVEPADSAIE